LKTFYASTSLLCGYGAIHKKLTANAANWHKLPQQVQLASSVWQRLCPSAPSPVVQLWLILLPVCSVQAIDQMKFTNLSDGQKGLMRIKL